MDMPTSSSQLAKITGQGPACEAFPFPEPNSAGHQAELETLQSLPNAQVLHTRLTVELVSEAMAHMPMPCRVVVSGPQGFNSAVREMLSSASVDDAAITILEA